MRERKAKIAIVRLAHGMWHHAAVGDWLSTTMLDFSRDQRVESIKQLWIDQAPVYAARNLAVKAAIQSEADLLFMVDADMGPDCYPGPTFAETAFNHWWNHDGPCVVTAPARMKNNQIAVHKAHVKDGLTHLTCMEASEVEFRKGIQQVPATGAGLIMIDMDCFRKLERPYFDFVYTDEQKTTVLAGEDVAFTAEMTRQGIPVYVAWDCWAGHHKEIAIGRPQTPGRNALSCPSS